MDPNSPFAELFKLSPAERMQLAEDLWDSVASQSGGDAIPLSDAQLGEIERRVREHDADPSTALAWEDVRKRLWAKAG